EQVIAPRSGRGNPPVGRVRVGSGNANTLQRPTTRRRRHSASTHGAAGRGSDGRRSLWRELVVYVPLALKCLLAIGIGVLIFAGYRAAAAASLFQAQVVDIDGTRRVAKDDLRAIVRRAVASTGVWRADLSAISDELKKQPWVRTVAVSRVLPSGLRVRVTEREPRAVVRNSAGRLVWVDDDGINLGTVSSTDHTPAFFMRGWDESGSPASRAGNRERVVKYLELTRDWNTQGLVHRVSEVNLDDLRDVRAQLAGDDSQVEVRLGGEMLSERLQQALKVLDEQRSTPRGPFITYVDLTPGTRAIIGTDVKAQAAAHEGTARQTRGVGNGGNGGSGHSGVKRKAESAAARQRDKVPPKTRSNRAARAPAVKTASGAVRPRRVG
ncbi:MAG: FtsQ-type POTRA domain-containing protein, partial [Acidobacteriota bacterium]|nr:FtsQ-type POTRA domain-containing protein [Acidobacteriota bacterium]